MDLAPPRGTRDFYPDEMRRRRWLFDHFREMARRFGFEEYDAPVLESEELYVRKSGEEIVDQLYSFEDKGGRRVALRPEMTPSLARMLLQRVRALSLPLRWFSIPQCWRYERMTRGRRREHYQWNMDIIGVADVTAEAELLGALEAFFEAVGLGPEDVAIRVSDRRVVQSVLEREGVSPERFGEICVLMDKLARRPREAVEQELRRCGIGPAAAGRILDVMETRSLDDLATILGDDHAAVRALRRLFELADSYGYREWLTFDASIVRGLAYYTGTVFEAFDRKGELRAVCGGGRYDRLLSTFGGEDLPACGFGFGDVVILELLKERQRLPEVPRRVDDLVFPLSGDLRGAAVQVATRLRRAGRSVDLVLEDRKAKWAYRHADRVGAARVLLVAPDEWSRGGVRAKDLVTGEEREVSREELEGPGEPTEGRIR